VDLHGEVNWIPVLLAAKTSGEICLRINTRLRFAALGADKDQLAVSATERPAQVSKQVTEVDLVAQTP